MNTAECKKEFIKTIKDLSHCRHIWQTFEDFVRCASIAVAQPFYRSEELEKQYMNIIKKYKPEETVKLSHLLSLTTMALEERQQDFLGALFMELELSNKWTGQFFTPYSVSKMMAQMTMGDDILNGKEYIKLQEPAAGSGGMVIAFAESMREKGINYQDKLFVQAIDIDSLCFDMCYVQLSLLGVPAEVVHGDTLSMKVYHSRFTAMYYLKLWEYKLSSPIDGEVVKMPKVKPEDLGEQMDLFVA